MKVRGLKWNQKKLRKSILHFTQNKNSQKVNITHQRLKTPQKKKKKWWDTCLENENLCLDLWIAFIETKTSKLQLGTKTIFSWVIIIKIKKQTNKQTKT